ncbi:MAG: UDP-N-acetylmuramoyl-L-alanyl-D-glutamate--2,6-diaminopimelate ligase, partial [Deltaproteobacteria bacterium]|nr:UDP-N-acetylmuramoyl-L-alanyl-D-glutamate--2,6-diaminopimelate ligase [Deltaproteobacteria bacterium]MBW2533817.1 UDP-N-acetylmuramoyl-L-alanyl-D-glutamate--2,6-diaminopimelate ligase [Deltaproteobacteria bacterium]
MTSPDSLRAPRPVPLGEVAAATGGEVRGDPTVLASGIRHDSRAIAPGDLFVARAGAHADGLSFV